MHEEKQPIFEKKEKQPIQAEKSTSQDDGHDGVEDEGCRAAQRGTIRLFVSCASITWIIADCVVDWIFYKNLIHVKRGLVLGPVSTDIQSSMLVFCCVGTAVSTASFMNVLYKGLCLQAMVKQETLFLLTIWLKNFPQIIISNVIAACQEVAVTYYQVIKSAMLIVATAAVGIIVSILGYLQSRRKTDNKPTCPTWKLLVIYFGAVVNIACASSVLFMVHISPVDEFGTVMTFKTPEGDFDMHQYLKEVEIFYHHPSFEENCEEENRTKNYWLRIGSIFEVAETGVEGLRVVYNHKNKENKTLYYLRRKHAELLEQMNCYVLDKENCLISLKEDCSNDFIKDHTTAISMSFRYILPSPSMLFGNIVYDAFTYNTSDKSTAKTPCIELETTLSKLRLNMTETAKIFGRAQYFENFPHGQKDHNAKPLLQQENITKFFEYHMLSDAHKIWRTGVARCLTTGYLGPEPSKFLKCP